MPFLHGDIDALVSRVVIWGDDILMFTWEELKDVQRCFLIKILCIKKQMPYTLVLEIWSLSIEIMAMERVFEISPSNPLSRNAFLSQQKGIKDIYNQIRKNSWEDGIQWISFMLPFCNVDVSWHGGNVEAHTLQIIIVAPHYKTIFLVEQGNRTYWCILEHIMLYETWTSAFIRS